MRPSVLLPTPLDCVSGRAGASVRFGPLAGFPDGPRRLVAPGAGAVARPRAVVQRARPGPGTWPPSRVPGLAGDRAGCPGGPVPGAWHRPAGGPDSAIAWRPRRAPLPRRVPLPNGRSVCPGGYRSPELGGPKRCRPRPGCRCAAERRPRVCGRAAGPRSWRRVGVSVRLRMRSSRAASYRIASSVGDSAMAAQTRNATMLTLRIDGKQEARSGRAAGAAHDQPGGAAGREHAHGRHGRVVHPAEQRPPGPARRPGWPRLPAAGSRPAALRPPPPPRSTNEITTSSGS